MKAFIRMTILAVILLLAWSAQGSGILVHYDFEDVVGEPNNADFESAPVTESHGIASVVTFQTDEAHRAVLNRALANTDDLTGRSISSGVISEGTAEGRQVAVDHANPADYGINENRYFTFTFMADAQGGGGVYLESFSLDFGHPGSAASGNRGFVVQYAIDGGTLVEAGWGRSSLADGATSNVAINYAIDLGGVELLNGQAIEIRVFKTNDNGSGNEVRYDNFMLGGSVMPDQGLAFGRDAGFIRVPMKANQWDLVGVSLDQVTEEKVALADVLGMVGFVNGTEVVVWDGAGYAASSFFQSNWTGTLELHRGQGFWIKSPVDMDLYLLGQMPEGEETMIDLPQGLQLVSAPYPATIDLNDGEILLSVPFNGDQLFFIGDGPGYTSNAYFMGTWSGAATLEPGKGYWYNSVNEQEMLIGKPY